MWSFEPAQLRDLMSAAGATDAGAHAAGVMLWAVEQGTLGDEFLASGGSWAKRSPGRGLGL